MTTEMKKTVTRVDTLTGAQRARMLEWRDRWIKVGLSTQPAARQTFKRAVAECYRAAKLDPPKRIVWVQSPLVLSIAAPIAAYILALRKQRGGAVGGAVGDAVRGAVGVAVGSAVDDAVRGAVGGAVGGAVRVAVGSAVDGAVRDAVDGAVDGAVGVAVGGAVDDAVRGAVDGAVRGAVDDAVGDAVRKGIPEAIRRAWFFVIGGQFWVGGWYWGSPAFVSFLTDVCKLRLSDDMMARAKAYAATASSACWWWPHRDFVMVCERPRIIDRDERGRLHRIDGPAVEFRDGWGVYAWHGVRAPEWIFTHPEQVTPEKIDAEKNQEIRRVMLERFGAEKYLASGGAEKISTDDVGELYRKTSGGREVVLMVKVINSSCESDGTRKTYWLRVDPECRPMLGGERFGERQVLTPRNAVASTFGLRGEEYVPAQQT